ncbi:putative DNA-invertase from lambdoid prophage Rac [Escherichia coli MS 124-1]|nr:putative DNA-invertase from lambdoid prophage Rac [Escherichia coli MS 124-1]
MSQIFAYCRISTLDQTTENQRREIESAGFKIKPQQIIEEHIRAQQQPVSVLVLTGCLLA